MNVKDLSLAFEKFKNLTRIEFAPLEKYLGTDHDTYFLDVSESIMIVLSAVETSGLHLTSSSTECDGFDSTYLSLVNAEPFSRLMRCFSQLESFILDCPSMPAEKTDISKAERTGELFAMALNRMKKLKCPATVLIKGS